MLFEIAVASGFTSYSSSHIVYRIHKAPLETERIDGSYSDLTVIQRSGDDRSGDDRSAMHHTALLIGNEENGGVTSYKYLCRTHLALQINYIYCVDGSAMRYRNGGKQVFVKYCKIYRVMCRSCRKCICSQDVFPDESIALNTMYQQLRISEIQGPEMRMYCCRGRAAVSATSQRK